MPIVDKICIGIILLIVAWIGILWMKGAFSGESIDDRRARHSWERKSTKTKREYYLFHAIISGIVLSIFLACLFLYDKNILSGFGFAVVFGGSLFALTRVKQEYDDENL